MAANEFPEKPEPDASVERARQWRRKADELLGIAENVTLRETKLTILSLAHSYARLATVMEHTAASDSTAPKKTGNSRPPETEQDLD